MIGPVLLQLAVVIRKQRAINWWKEGVAGNSTTPASVESPERPPGGFVRSEATGSEPRFPSTLGSRGLPLLQTLVSWGKTDD